MESKSASVSSDTLRVMPRPALFTHTSMCPSFSSALATARSTSARRVTSVTSGSASGPGPSCNLAELLLAAGQQHHVRALFRDVLCQRRADTRAGARDCDHLSLHAAERSGARVIRSTPDAARAQPGGHSTCGAGDLRRRHRGEAEPRVSRGRGLRRPTWCSRGTAWSCSVGQSSRSVSGRGAGVKLCRCHSDSLARRAPSASVSSLAQTIDGSTLVMPAKVEKPQSVPAMTLSRPTSLAIALDALRRPAPGAR